MDRTDIAGQRLYCWGLCMKHLLGKKGSVQRQQKNVINHLLVFFSDRRFYLDIIAFCPYDKINIKSKYLLINF